MTPCRIKITAIMCHYAISEEIAIIVIDSDVVNMLFSNRGNSLYFFCFKTIIR